MTPLLSSQSWTPDWLGELVCVPKHTASRQQSTNERKAHTEEEGGPCLACSKDHVQSSRRRTRQLFKAPVDVRGGAENVIGVSVTVSAASG